MAWIVNNPLMHLGIFLSVFFGWMGSGFGEYPSSSKPCKAIIRPDRMIGF